jgi:hypothetical protein
MARHYDRPHDMAEQVEASLAKAEREGRFARALKHFCGACREQVDSIYYIAPGSRVHLCPECADKAGQGPIADGRR